VALLRVSLIENDLLTSKLLPDSDLFMFIYKTYNIAYIYIILSFSPLVNQPPPLNLDDISFLNLFYIFLTSEN